MDVVLIRVQEDGETAAVPLTRSKTVIGRGEDAGVRVAAASVSRKHCEVAVSGEGSIRIRDLGSSNGTFVNQERVDEHPLAAGDLVSFGGFVFVVRVNGEPEDIDAALMFEDGLPEADAGKPAKVGPTHPTQTGSGGGAPPERASLVPAGDLDESSVIDFDFDLDEDEDDQPPL